MSQKRKRSEDTTAEAVHPSRQAQVPGAIPKPAKKPRRSEPITYKKQAHASSVNAIKKKIRDVTRKLERSDTLPANLKADDERALAAYHQELEEAEQEKLRQKMIKKYHMVRFFERQKATRLLKRLRKRVLEADSTDEVESLKAQMHIAEVDLNYTQYSPLSEIYISLYPPKTNDKDEDDGTESTEPQPKPPLWAEVENCMKDGTLNKLRNRAAKLQPSASKPTTNKKLVKVPKLPKAKPQPTLDTTGLNRRERRRAERGEGMGIGTKKDKNRSIGFAKNKEFGASIAAKQYEENANMDDDSDGGFFEE